MRRALALLAALAAPAAALAQQIDMSHGGPLSVTAQDGLELRQAEQEVVARGNARAVRDQVTVQADELVAHYRKKAGPPGQPTPAAAPVVPQGGQAVGGEADSSGNEIYRVEAVGGVQIFTPTDRAVGDRAVYDIDQAVLVLTGRNLKLTTPNDVLTARDSLEYWAQKKMAVARGDAVVVTNDAKRLAGDTLVAYTEDSAPGGAPVRPAAAKAPAAGDPGAGSDPLGASGKLKKVEAFGHVSVRTATEIVTGDRAVYVPDTGIARLGGNVRITRGQNQLNGAEAEVNMKTGVSRLLSSPGLRVQGLVLPNDPSNKADLNDPPKGGPRK